MADLPTNLRTKLTGTAAISAIVSTRVHQSHVPEFVEAPYIWFQRSRTDEPRTLGGDAPAGYEQQFDVECIAEDLDTAQDLASKVKAAINNFRGTMGTQTVQGVFVEDHSDDYIARGISSDEGVSVAALQVTIYQAAGA